MTQTVVSAGATRLFAGIGLGVAKARIEAIVVLVEEFRLTMPESASVPVFTDQRSTPHCAIKVEGNARTTATTSKKKRRKFTRFTLLPVFFVSPSTAFATITDKHRLHGLKTGEIFLVHVE